MTETLSPSTRHILDVVDADERAKSAPPPAPVAPAPAPPPVAAPGSPELQVAQAGSDLSTLAATQTPYAGGTPDGVVTATPRQATADLLNSGERSKGLEREEGRIKGDEQTRIAAKNTEAAAEKIQQSADYDQLLSQSSQKYDEAHAATIDAYSKYKAAAGTLKDPETQFYEDKGQAFRIREGLAAFAAGLGAGFHGESGNPVIEQLNRKVQANYEAHKQNIQDLYNSSVAAGKIEDTVENHSKFMQDAKLRSYELQNAHFKDELSAIAATAASPLAKVAAQKTIEGINQNEVVLKQKLAQQEAQGAAAKLAAERQRSKEVREAFQKALEKHADLAPEEARIEATKDLHSLGFNRSETAPIFEANGVQANPETGEPIFPESRGATGPAEPSYDDAGKLLVPSHDSATGKQLKPEERKAIGDEARKRTVIVDGKPQIAVSEEAAKKFAGIQSAVPEAKRLIGVLQKAFNDGDKGAYDQARNQLIEISPVIYGFTRGPSAAQAGETGGGTGDHEGNGTIAGQIPEFNPTLLGRYSKTIAGFNNTHSIGGNTPAAVAQQKLAGLTQSIEHIAADAHQQAFGGGNDLPKASPSVAELAASFGGKKL